MTPEETVFVRVNYSIKASFHIYFLVLFYSKLVLRLDRMSTTVEFTTWLRNPDSSESGVVDTKYNFSINTTCTARDDCFAVKKKFVCFFFCSNYHLKHNHGQIMQSLLGLSSSRLLFEFVINMQDFCILELINM